MLNNLNSNSISNIRSSSPNSISSTRKVTNVRFSTGNNICPVFKVTSDLTNIQFLPSPLIIPSTQLNKPIIQPNLNNILIQSPSMSQIPILHQHNIVPITFENNIERSTSKGKNKKLSLINNRQI